MKAVLIKRFKNARKKFESQLSSNEKNWAQSFAEMRISFKTCLEEIEDLVLVANEYLCIMTITGSEDIKKITPDYIVVDCSLLELTMELGWLLCHKYIEKKNEVIFQSIISCIMLALLRYMNINTLCADIIHAEDSDSTFDKESYYNAALLAYQHCLTHLIQLELDSIVDFADIDHALLIIYLQLGQLAVIKNNWDDAEKHLDNYFILSSQYEQVEENTASPLYITLKKNIEEHQYRENSKKEINRTKKKKIALNNIEKKIELTVDIDLLKAFSFSLTQKKLNEINLTILKKIEVLHSKIIQKIELLTREVITQTLTELLNEIEQQDEVLRNVPDSINSEQTTELLAYHIDDVSELTDNSELLNSSALEIVKLILDDIITDLMTYRFSEEPTTMQKSLKNFSESFVSYYFIWPECLKNNYLSGLFFALCELFDKYQCNAYLYGSANRLINPNDLDLLVDNSEPCKIQSLIGEIVVCWKGMVVANYEKHNRRVIKIDCSSILLDLVLSTKTPLEHAIGNFSINTYFDMRSKMMLCMHPSSLFHIERKQLHTISDARWTFENDPYRLFRAIYLRASQNYSFSSETYCGIQEAFSFQNLFLQKNIEMNPDRLYRGLILLFFSGYSVITLNILIYELNLFEKLFTRINELNDKDRLLTMQLVYDVAALSDSQYQTNFPFPSSIPPSLFYYAVHWLVFVKDYGIGSQNSVPFIRLPVANEGEYYDNINYLHSKHVQYRPLITSQPSFFHKQKLLQKKLVMQPNSSLIHLDETRLSSPFL